MNKIKRTKKGIVVSDKMDKTVVVNIQRVVEHPLYKKKFTLSKKYKADDPENQYKVGDTVEIVGVAPISKDKKYKVVRKLIN